MSLTNKSGNSGGFQQRKSLLELTGSGTALTDCFAPLLKELKGKDVASTGLIGLVQVVDRCCSERLRSQKTWKGHLSCEGLDLGLGFGGQHRLEEEQGGAARGWYQSCKCVQWSGCLRCPRFSSIPAPLHQNSLHVNSHAFGDTSALLSHPTHTRPQGDPQMGNHTPTAKLILPTESILAGTSTSIPLPFRHSTPAAPTADSP